LLSPIAKTLEKALLPHITQNVPQNPHQHGFKALHSTTTALHQLTNQITQGFNQKPPPLRTIVVSLDLSKAFDTVNIHSLINKLHHTAVPTTIIKFIASYIKGRKGFTQYQNAKSKLQQFKTGVPQGGVLSPTLFNLYTSDMPNPPAGVTLTSYADDMNPAASHQNYRIAEQLLQPYLHDIFNWTKENDLILNPDKSTTTLFTPDTHEHNITLNLTINNTTIPTVKNPKILGLTLDPAFTFAEHAKITKDKADSAIKILKALTSTIWGKQKETLLATYKTIILPVIEYASTVWSPAISDTNLQKLQTTQNNALRIITGCTADTNIQHLHTETKTLPLNNHLKLHASQLRQKSQLPTHPLHDLNRQTNCPRQMKETIFENWNGKTIIINNTSATPPTPDSTSQNIKKIHTMIVEECLRSYKPNPILSQPAPNINQSEQSLPRKTRRILAQLRAGKSPILLSYMHAIDPTSHPSSSCPLCKYQEHTTQHLFFCPKINTTLTARDLWDDPVAVATLLKQWDDALGAAGGGAGSSLM
jgi:retron-type reverse transcriptase